MSIPNELPTAEQVAAEGYFTKCAGGDMRACSLYARLVAQRLNPTGDPNSWGWLSKSAGESNQDGFADDAIVYGSNGQNNVIDLVGGSGVPGARVQWGGPNPRRPSNNWVAPRPLTADEMNYLKAGSGTGGGTVPPVTPPVKPCPDPSAHVPKPKPQYQGDAYYREKVGKVLAADYARRPQDLDAGVVVWAARVIWDHVNEGMTIEDAIKKQREGPDGWLKALGLTP